MKIKTAISILIILIGLPFAQSYILKSYCIDDGGTARVATSNYIMGGSLSQKFVGRSSTGNYIVHIGYWTPIIMPYYGINEADHSRNPEVSLVFSLNQNYPNPVSSRTTIKYSIASPCQVELKLYDITGRHVATLVNENQKPGNYQVNWNIRNVSERRLPNGVYFYRLTTGDFTHTKKMVVVR